MVAVCIVSKNGKLIKIKEVHDIYRYMEYTWDED